MLKKTKRKRELVDIRNALESAIYQAEKMKDEYKDKISKDDEKALNEAVEEAKKHQSSEDKEELESATKALNDAIMPIGAKMYESASKEKSTGSDKSADSGEPVEGEVVDEDKK